MNEHIKPKREPTGRPAASIEGEATSVAKPCLLTRLKAAPIAHALERYLAAIRSIGITVVPNASKALLGAASSVFVQALARTLGLLVLPDHQPLRKGSNE